MLVTNVETCTLVTIVAETDIVPNAKDTSEKSGLKK
jgi:hypothetical protein